MNSTDTLQTAFMHDRDIFLNTLSSFTIVDIGTIREVNEEGRAVVVSSTFMDNKPIIYEDAEVIYPGNANGSFACNPVNMACLIFLPRSCMPKVNDLVLRIGATSYNRDGVKALPIGNGTMNTVKALFSDGGTLNFLSKYYTWSFTESTVTLDAADGKTSLLVDGKGQLYVHRYSDKGTYDCNIDDEGVLKTWLSENQNVRWEDALLPDGSRTFTQLDPNNEGDPLLKLSISPGGAVEIKIAKAVTLETKDALTLKGKSVSIESTDSTVDITSKTDTTVTTGDSNKFAVNGTNLEVTK